MPASYSEPPFGDDEQGLNEKERAKEQGKPPTPQGHKGCEQVTERAEGEWGEQRQGRAVPREWRKAIRTKEFFRREDIPAFPPKLGDGSRAPGRLHQRRHGNAEGGGRERETSRNHLGNRKHHDAAGEPANGQPKAGGGNGNDGGDGCVEDRRGHDELQKRGDVETARAARYRVGAAPGAQVGEPCPEAVDGRREDQRGGGGEGHAHAAHQHTAKQRWCPDEAGNGQEQPGNENAGPRANSIRGQDEDEHHGGAPGCDSCPKGDVRRVRGVRSGDIDGEYGDDQSCGGPDELRLVA